MNINNLLKMQLNQLETFCESTNLSPVNDDIIIENEIKSTLEGYSLLVTNNREFNYCLSINDSYYSLLEGNNKLFLYCIKDLNNSENDNQVIKEFEKSKNITESLDTFDFNVYGIETIKEIKINTIKEVNEAIQLYSYVSESYQDELKVNINKRLKSLDTKVELSCSNPFYPLIDKNYCISVNENTINDINLNSFSNYNSIVQKIEEEKIKNSIHIPNTTKLSNYIDFSKYFYDTTKVYSEVLKIKKIKSSTINRYKKLSNYTTKFDESDISKLTIMNKFKELFEIENEFNSFLLCGINKEEIDLIIRDVYTNNILLIPLYTIDKTEIGSKNLMILNLDESDIENNMKLIIKKLSPIKKSVNMENLTQLTENKSPLELLAESYNIKENDELNIECDKNNKAFVLFTILYSFSKYKFSDKLNKMWCKSFRQEYFEFRQNNPQEEFIKAYKKSMFYEQLFEKEKDQKKKDKELIKLSSFLQKLMMI